MSIKDYIMDLFTEKPSANTKIINVTDEHSTHMAAHMAAIGGPLTVTCQTPQAYTPAAQNAIQNNMQGLQQQLNANMYGIQQQNIQLNQLGAQSVQYNNILGGGPGNILTYSSQQPLWQSTPWYLDPIAVQHKLDLYSVETQNLYKDLNKLNNNILSHSLLTEQCNIIEAHFKNNKFKNKLEDIINE